MMSSQAIISEHPATEATRVLVVEDHAIIREGVCLLLQREPDIQVVGAVGTGEDAVSFVQRNKPDVVVMDLGLPGISGLEATREIKKDNPDVRVLALTMYTDDEYLLGMLDAGAAGYLLKQSAVNDLVPAVRTISNGQIFLHPQATRTVVESLRRPRAQEHASDALTEREKDVLRLVGQGCSSKEIARKLFLSPRTVDNYRSRIMEKLQVRNCFEAVAAAIKQGIIEPLS